MKSRFILPLSLTAALIMVTVVTAEDLKPGKLPEPQLTIGKPLMEVLKARKSSRDFKRDSLPVQTMSNLLWAACGINRPEAGKRTAPTARNKQEIDVYVATAKGVFLYDAKNHSLELILSEDIRAKCGTQEYVKDVPVNLVFVADYTRMTERTEAENQALSWADTGFISQNVYLYCASEGLATVIRALIDRDELAKVMKLRPEQKITLSQSVGLPQSK
jgi:SagB-type dehydrogenase family enzyme